MPSAGRTGATTWRSPLKKRRPASPPSSSFLVTRNAENAGDWGRSAAPQPAGPVTAGARSVTSRGFSPWPAPVLNVTGPAKSCVIPARSAAVRARVRGDKTLVIQIPGGVEDGNRLRLSGEGDAGLLGGPSGDLYVVVHVEDHSFFERQDNNLYCSDSDFLHSGRPWGHPQDSHAQEGREASHPRRDPIGLRIPNEGKGLPQAGWPWHRGFICSGYGRGLPSGFRESSGICSSSWMEHCPAKTRPARGKISST